jgi:hypothetical protein
MCGKQHRPHTRTRSLAFTPQQCWPPWLRHSSSPGLSALQDPPPGISRAWQLGAAYLWPPWLRLRCAQFGLGSPSPGSSPGRCFILLASPRYFRCVAVGCRLFLAAMATPPLRPIRFRHAPIGGAAAVHSAGRCLRRRCEANHRMHAGARLPPPGILIGWRRAETPFSPPFSTPTHQSLCFYS